MSEIKSIATNDNGKVVDRPVVCKKKGLIPRTLSTRLTLLFVFLLAFAMSAFTIHGILEQSQQFANNMKLQARGLAQNLSAVSADHMLKKDYISIELSLLRAARFPGIMQIQISDATGKRIGDVYRDEHDEAQARYDQPPLNPPETAEEKIIFDTETMIIWQPVILGELLGWVKIQYSLESIKNELRAIWGQNSLVGIVVIIITGLVLTYFLRTTINGIRAYTEFAGRLNRDMGKSTEIFDCSTELETLGNSLNEVSTRLKEQNDEINNAMKALERTAASVEFAPNIILSLDENCEIKYINPYGINTIKTLNNSQDDIFSILPKNLSKLINQVVFGQEIIAEISVEYSDKHYLWTLAPVPGQAIVHAYGVDVTKRREAEQKAREAIIEKYSAEEANLAKSQFLANMSHELRTPLNAVIGYSEIIKEDSEANYPEIIPDLDRIHSAAHHLLSLINEILDLSKIESGRMELFFEEFDLIKLVKEVVDTARPLAQKNHNTLSVDVEERPFIVYSDLIKIKQILYNLISNAAKFTENGFIEVKLSDQIEDNEHWIIFDVKDSGIGMSNGQIHHVFEPFSQADNSTTRKYGGTGLGLAITKRYCEMLGGDIHVNSTPGRGSVFSIHIPVQPFCPLKENA